MINSEALVKTVLEYVNWKRNAQNNSSEFKEEDIRDVLQALEDLNFRIVSQKQIVDDYRMEEASEVITSWIPEEFHISVTDINTAQIFSDLVHRGWLILPPP
jgi:hypothetical protein